jgi:NADPH:quinone reductase-like Zn-dependent oxidoreductase
MLARAGLRAGETIVITGAAGGVGSALIQLSLAREARVVAVASAAKRDQILELGAHAFVARETDDLLADLEAIVGQRGAHVAADVVGGEMLLPLLKVLCRAGRYSTAGAIGGPVARMDLRELIYKDLEMHGITCPTAPTFARLVHLIEAGKLRPLLDGAYSLEELGTVQKEMVKRTHFGKFVVHP